MSKAIAIEGVMKIFLMIAVIIVGMSFLLKAFGVDVFSWFKKFEAFGIPEKGPSIHVKLDSDDTEIWEFHVNEQLKHFSGEEGEHKKFFYLDNFPQDKCTLLVTHETSPEIDLADYYYISTGGVIQYDCNEDRVETNDNIRSCLGSHISQPSCKTLTAANKECTKCKDQPGSLEVDCPGPSHYVDCKESYPREDELCEHDPPFAKSKFGKKVVDINFAFAHSSKVGDDCKDKPHLCNLLNKNEEDETEYLVKYGVLCQNGLWRVCKQDKNGEPILTTFTVGADTYKCIKTNENFFVWKKQ